MRELLERLEKAEAGSAELDEEIHGLLCASKYRTCIAGLPDAVGGLWMYEFAGHNPSSALRCTTSLDAALALAERVLPGWSRGVFEDEPGNRPPWLATLTEVCDARAVEEHEGAGATAPLALCLAILRATQSQHTPEGEM